MPHDIFRVEDFPDTGCNLAPCCLTCPLPRCKHDLPSPTGKTARRQVDILPLLAQGLTGEQIAQRLGTTRRNVQRVKATMRKG